VNTSKNSSTIVIINDEEVINTNQHCEFNMQLDDNNIQINTCSEKKVSSDAEMPEDRKEK